MSMFDHQDTVQKGGGEVKTSGLPEIEVFLPGGTDYVLVNKNICKRIYKDDFPKLLIVIDEVAELLQPSGVKTEEGKAEDALKQEIVGHIQSITQLGRSAGIHMILAPLALDTVIPTLNGTGYKTIGEIEIGDFVFDINNKPTMVVGLSEIKMSNKMFKMIVNYKNDIIEIKSDEKHRFKILDGRQEKIVPMKDIYELQDKGIKILGLSDNSNIEWNIQSIKIIDNEPVRCIEVASNTHMFLITDKNHINKDWENTEIFEDKKLELEFLKLINDIKIIQGSLKDISDEELNILKEKLNNMPK